jgi:hypothetical protein
MRKLVAFVLVIGVSGALCAEELVQKPKLEPYGFLKGDFCYANNPVASWSSPSPSAVTKAVGDGPSSIAFTAQHSRFGLKGSAEVKGVTVGGVLELDFFSVTSNTNANANPRIRLGYAYCMPLKGLEIRAGQQWDVFSPLNPTTNNTNANMWFVGNYGFRRPQFQVRYGVASDAFAPGIQLSVGEAAKEADASLGGDNLSLMPMLQGRLSAVILKMVTVGVAGTYAAFDKDKDNTSAGFSADLSAALHKLFELNGEFCYGADLNDANLFTIGGSGAGAETVENIGFWVNAISKPLSFLQIVAGFGQEVTTGALESNLTAYGDLIIPIGAFFSLSAEYQFIQTTPKDADPFNASVVDVAGKVTF